MKAHAALLGVGDIKLGDGWLPCCCPAHAVALVMERAEFTLSEYLAIYKSIGKGIELDICLRLLNIVAGCCNVLRTGRAITSFV